MTSADADRPTPRDRRIVKHIQALTEAGTDIKKFIQALERMKDDISLTQPQREAIFKTLAQDAASAYFVFATGNPIDLEELGQRMEQLDDDPFKKK